jgi:hypothetical protein
MTGGVVLHVRVIAPEAILSDGTTAGHEIRDEDSGIIAAPASDDVAASQRVHSAEASAVSQYGVNPAGFQCRIVGWSQVRTDWVRFCGRGAFNDICRAGESYVAEGNFVFSLWPALVYPAIERIQISALWVYGLRWRAGHYRFCDFSTSETWLDQNWGSRRKRKQDLWANEDSPAAAIREEHWSTLTAREIKIMAELRGFRVARPVQKPVQLAPRCTSEAL